MAEIVLQLLCQVMWHSSEKLRILSLNRNAVAVTVVRRLETHPAYKKPIQQCVRRVVNVKNINCLKALLLRYLSSLIKKRRIQLGRLQTNQPNTHTVEVNE